MKTVLYSTILPLVLLTTLFSTRALAQPVGCGALNLSVEEINTCTYRLYFNNLGDTCFHQLNLLLDAGEFDSWLPNGGWNVVPVSPTELQVTPNSGLIPSGAGYAVDVVVSGDASLLTVLYYDDCPPGEGCFAEFAVTGCPDPQDASIIGVKYKECGILPFSNQTPLAGWVIQLFDQDDNLLAEDLTDSTGAFGFYDLLGGVYKVREVQQPGWTPKVPATGEYAVDLGASEQRNVNYGNCPPPKPPCNCPAGTQPGATNLVQNGDFSGSGGFSSGYAQNNNNPPLQPGQYWVGSNPNAINGGFAACGDHTGGGNMLVVNGGPSPNTPFWCETVTVTPNTNYIFEAWTASLTGASPANLSLFVIINSLNVQYEVGRIFPSGTTCDWQRWCETWQTGNYTSITLCLYDLNPTASGNDFAVDDISFRRCVNPLAKITGVVYQSCDSMPYTDQPTLSGWTVQLLDTLGNVLDEQVTDSSGAYAFADLPPGWYWVKTAVQPDWHPIIPAFGRSLLEVGPGAEIVQDFSMCQLPASACSCPLPNSPGPNLLSNPNFSQPGGFGTQYVLNTGNPPLQSGEYWIGSNPNAINSTFPACSDHTTGTGNMLVVVAPPGSPISNLTFWSPLLPIPVTPNTNYLFSVWINGLDPTQGGQVVLLVNNSPVASHLFYSSQCNWKRFCVSWNSGSNTSVTLKLNGNFFFNPPLAFAIDDVSFRRCGIPDVSGVVYRSCDALPYTDQPTLTDWTVQLLDTLGNLLAEQVTDSTGAYAFDDLPPGNYVVKAAVQPGWTANFPVNGQIAVELDGGEEVVENFGVCPVCSCDSIYLTLTQEDGSSDTSDYFLTILSDTSLCFSSIHIEVDTGQLLNWDLLLPGWSVTQQSASLIQLSAPDNMLPAGGFIPLRLQVGGGDSIHKIIVTTYSGTGPDQLACERAFVYPNPPMPLANDCCPAGNAQGPELVVSGGFNCSMLNPCFNYLGYGYTFPNGANPTGYIAFGPLADFAIINSSWHPPVKANSLWNNILGVNGSTSPSAIAWEQTPTVAGNTQYAFCAYACNMRSSGNLADPIVQIRIVDGANNILFSDQATIPETSPWIKLGGLWTSPATYSGPYKLQVKSLSTAVQGNDFGVDCISFRTCNLPCQASFTTTPIDNCGKYQFTNTSANLPTAGVQYCWDFDNNPATCESTAASPMWQFPNCGEIYNACLTITGNGCSSMSCQTIAVSESIPPTALCQPAIGIDVGTDCSLTVTPAMIDAGSYDDCQLAGMSVDPALITCGTTTVTLTVTDWCGNTATCTTDIQIGEGEPPMITCPFGISANCNVNVDPTFAGFATATDNCTADIKIMYSYSDVIFGTIDCDDHIERTWVAEDLCGNTSSCVQVISVKDNIPPVITNCPPSVNVNMTAGQCYYIFTAQPSLTFSDNCDPTPTLSCTYEEPSGAIWPLTSGVHLPKGANTIRCTVTDDCGNVSATCTRILTVIDNQQPTLTCPQNITVQTVYNAAGLCQAVVNNIAPTVSDNCPLMGLDYLIAPSGAAGQNDASGTLFEGVSTVTYTATDCGGFVKTCSFTVSVLCPPCTPTPGAACADALNLTAACIPNVFGQYDFSLQVQNQSGFQADRIELTAVTPGGAITQTVFNATLANGATSAPLTTTLNGVPGGTVCFKILLVRTAPNGVVLECCETAQTFCVTLPECPGPCDCAGADNLSFTYTGFTPNVSWPGPISAVCGDPNPVMLPCVPEGETPFAFHGVAHCDMADCILSNYTWEVTDPAGTVVIPGGTGPFSFIVGQDGHFDIGLFSNNLTPLVTYTLKVTWYCGGKICTCEVKFQLDVCDCHCINPVSNVAITSGTLTLSAPCGTTLFQGIPCPPAGNFVKVTGYFQCIGTECLPGKIVRYTLTGPNGPVTTGAVLATPYFSINLLPQLLYDVGQYTITMTGECNGQPCTPCTFSFYHQCPDPCPCPDATFNNRVDQGFTVASTGVACKACFIPKQLGQCETVQWFVNGVGPIGATTTGNAPFCYTFSSTAIYQIEMRVTRKKSDGTVCATRSKFQYPKILCDPSNLPCSADVVSNPGFGEGAVPGGLNSGGESPGWQGAYGDPVVQEGGGASDGWAVMLSGNRESADVLSREATLCWVKDTGTISLRLQVWGINHIAAQKPGETLVLRLYRDSVPNPLTDSCDGVGCLELVALLPFPPDSGEWFTLEIPYDLTAWSAADSCGAPVPEPLGVRVNPVLYVTNWLGSESGSAEETKSMILIDNFCFDGQSVGVKDPASKGRIRIFPNPNAGDFTVELPGPAGRDTRLRVVGLTGQVLLEKQTETGSARQKVQAGDLPAGLYFLQVVGEGRVLAVGKFVKE